MSVRARFVSLAALAATLASLGAVTRSDAGRAAPPPLACATGFSEAFQSFSGRLIATDDVELCVSGELTVTYHGDRASGCARWGTCDASGTEVWRPDGDGDLTILTVESHGRRRRLPTLAFGVRSSLQGTTAATAPGGPPACLDRRPDVDAPARAVIVGDQLTVAPLDRDVGVLGTRCGGPLDRDVAPSLPAVTVPLTRVLHASTTIDLASTSTFAAHGFAGTTVSTLSLLTGLVTHTGAPRNPRRLEHGARVRVDTATYRVVAAHGAVRARVTGGRGRGSCGRLNACGARGTITLGLGRPAGRLQLVASAPARRPKRDLLAALGLARTGDIRGIAIAGFGFPTVRGAVSARARGAGGRCRDRGEAPFFDLSLRRRADRLRYTLTPLGADASDPLLTRCPGPVLGGHRLTAGTVALSALRSRRLTLTTHGVPFDDGPYRVVPHSTVRLTLRRVSIRSRVVTVPREPAGASAAQRCRSYISATQRPPRRAASSSSIVSAGPGGGCGIG